MLWFVFAIGIMFGSLGALAAYLIMYGEYHHHYPDDSEPKKIALNAAIMTFSFFTILSLVLALFLPSIVK